MKMEFMFNAIFKKEVEGGYSAFCPELGVASQGETIEEAEANLKEACELYIESAKEVGILERILEESGVQNKEIAPVLTGSIRTQVTV
jgi:predicted RNase H-like HicB family nuclease